MEFSSSPLPVNMKDMNKLIIPLQNEVVDISLLKAALYSTIAVPYDSTTQNIHFIMTTLRLYSDKCFL